MLRATTILLIATQIAGFAAPSMCAPGAHEAPACEHVAPVSGQAAVDAHDPCDACGMPGCHDMASCAAGATALAASVAESGPHGALEATVVESVAALHNRATPPVRPPPRA